MSTSVELQRDGHVARVIFRGDNGIQLLTSDVRTELNRILKEIESDADCRVVVFAAEGKVFIAGADINELRAQTSKTARKFARDGQRLFQRIADLSAVSIAAIHGACAGGGCELALACDLRIASTGAKIGLPEVSLGLLPGWGGTARATLLFGPAVAKRMILTGELLPAEVALRIGLVDEVVPDDQLRAVVDARVAQVLSRGPAAVLRSKRLIEEFGMRSLDRLLRREAAQFAACYATGEPAEGSTAFLEKRTPEWTASGRGVRRKRPDKN